MYVRYTTMHCFFRVETNKSVAQKRPSSEATEAVPSKRARRPKPYVPFFRSGAYAIIVALSSAGEEASRVYSKPEVIELAQCHCDSSFTAPSDPTKFYTAWNSMKTLMEKDLIFERGRPLRKYGLTEDGWEVARRIRNASQVNRDLLQVDQVPSTKVRAFCTASVLQKLLRIVSLLRVYPKADRRRCSAE